jgi:hypothetical protein
MLQSSFQPNNPALKSWLDNLWGWLFLAGVFILPLVVLVAVSIPERVSSGKQVTFDRARESLWAALSEYPAGGGQEFPPKQYGYFVVYSTTNTASVFGHQYHLAFYTADGYQFNGQGKLAVTTNGEFIWLDYRRGPKLIPADYKVSRWQSGY